MVSKLELRGVKLPQLITYIIITQDLKLTDPILFQEQGQITGSLTLGLRDLKTNKLSNFKKNIKNRKECRF